MPRLLVIIIFLQSYAIAQDTPFRFQASLSLQSILNYGTRNFSGLEKDQGTPSKYEREWYDIDYKNSTISNGFNLKFGINWLNREKYSLRTSTSFFIEIYSEEVHYKLVDFEIGDTAFFPNSKIVEEVELGYTGSAIFQGIGLGFTSAILYLRKFSKRIAIGAGVTYTLRTRDDLPKYTTGYAPISSMRSTPIYTTKQLGVAFQLERSFDRWSWFINVNQEMLTIKKEENKGALFFNNPFTKFPVSQNLDYRFPLIIQFGGTIQFDKIKK